MSYPVFYPVAGDTLPILFDTFDGGSGASITMTGLAVTDIEIYKAGSTTQRASDAGYTLLDTDGIDFDSITGIHGFSIDLSDNTDSGFYTAGSWYHVIVSTITIDGQTVSFIAAAFRIVSATRGLAGTALPDAAADAAGGLPISDAGGLDLDALNTAVAAILDDTDLIDDGTSGLAKIATDVAAILVDTADIQPKLGTINDLGNGATVGDNLQDLAGATFDTSTDSQEAIRNRGDAAWTTGAGGTPPQLLQSTTIATLASQVSFTLTAGSADNNAYNNCIAIITDQSTSTQKAVGYISAYTGSTKTVTLKADPGIFTMAAGDTINIIAPSAAILANSILHGGTAGLLTLERIVVASTTTNQPAVLLTGNAVGAGLAARGGADGHGIWADGNGSNGDGIHAEGGPFGLRATGTVAGISGEGNANGAGIRAMGGVNDGTIGILASSQATNGDGMSLVGKGSGLDLDATTTDDLEVNVTGIEGSDPTDQIRDSVVDDATRIDASALNTLSGFAPDNTIADVDDVAAVSGLDAAGVRDAVGLATANLDTQLDALPTAVENADALLGRNIAGGSSAGRLVKDALRALRNRVAVASGTMTVYEEDDSTSAWTAAVTEDAGADPITEIDPS